MADDKKSAPTGGSQHKYMKDLEEQAKKLGDAVSLNVFASFIIRYLILIYKGLSIIGIDSNHLFFPSLSSRNLLSILMKKLKI